MKIRIKRDRLIGYELLALSSIFYILIATSNAISTFNYLVELVLLALTIIMLNSETLIATNTLFLAYFCYTVALGPLVLLSADINSGENTNSLFVPAYFGHDIW